MREREGKNGWEGERARVRRVKIEQESFRGEKSREGEKRKQVVKTQLLSLDEREMKSRHCYTTHFIS